MTFNTLHAGDALQGAEEIERIWDPEAERASRGPAVCTSVTLEQTFGGEKKVIARRNLYGFAAIAIQYPHAVVLSKAHFPDDTHYMRAKPTSLEDLHSTLPLWATNMLYMGDSYVLPEYRKQGIYTQLTREALNYIVNMVPKRQQPQDYLPKIAFGITKEPPVIAMAKTLEGSVATGACLEMDSAIYTPEYFGFELQGDPSFGEFYAVSVKARKEGSASSVIFVDHMIQTPNGDENLGLVTMHNTSAAREGTIAMIIPERAIHDSTSPDLPKNKPLDGQTLVVLNPHLTPESFKQYEEPIARVLALSRWGSVIQLSEKDLRSGDSTEVPLKDYSGDIFKPADFQVFTVPVKKRT